MSSEWEKTKMQMQEAREKRRQGVTVSPGVTRGAAVPSPSSVLGRTNSATNTLSGTAGSIRRTSGTGGTLPAPASLTASGSRRGAPALARSEPPRASEPPDGDWQKLYESEVKIRQDLEQELATLKGTSDSSAGGAARELSLVKTELKVLKMKYDTEVRKRETLEKDLAKLKEGNSADAPAAVATPSTPSATASKTEATPRTLNINVGGPSRAAPGASRASSRMSVMKEKSPNVNIIATISRVLTEMEKLENNIKRADSAREKAEAELLEVAMYKQAADEALQSLINDLTAHITTLGTGLSTLGDRIKSGGTKGDLETGIQNVERVKNEINFRLQVAKNASASEAEIASRAASLASKLDDPNAPSAPSPPPAPGPPAPGPPPGPTRATRPVRSGTDGGGAGSRASTLLSQIRKGKDLNKIDINAIKQERQLYTSNSRTSMALLSSLQETLRAALNARQDDMNLYGEDDADDWDE